MPPIEQIFPTCRGVFFNVNKADFENFKNHVVNNPLVSWMVTKINDGQLVEIPGTWTTETSGGNKRSGKKRKSQKKRSGKKRSDKKSRRH